MPASKPCKSLLLWQLCRHSGGDRRSMQYGRLATLEVNRPWALKTTGLTLAIVAAAATTSESEGPRCSWLLAGDTGGTKFGSTSRQGNGKTTKGDGCRPTKVMQGNCNVASKVWQTRPPLALPRAQKLLYPSPIAGSNMSTEC